MAKKGEYILNRFTIDEEIFADRAASTYLGNDSEGGRVLIWEVRIEALDSWDTIDGFEKRAEQYRDISCASLPRFVGYYSDDSSDNPAIYFICEFVDGDSLESVVETNGPLSGDETKAMLQDLLKALVSLHQLTPPVVNGRIQPSAIVHTETGRYRFSELPLPELSSIQTGGPRPVADREAYTPSEQRTRGAVPMSDIFSLGMCALYSLSGRHPDRRPSSRLQNRPDPIYQIIDAMTEPDVSDRRMSALEILSWLSDSNHTPAESVPSETGVIRDSAVEIVSSPDRDKVSVFNPVASRPESLLIGFFLDLWATKPWLIILIAAALSAGPIAIPLLIFLLHPKSKILLNRAYAKYRDVFLKLERQTLSVSDQVKVVEYADIADYEIHENPNVSGVQLETVLKMRSGKEIRFYLNSLSRGEARRIRKLIDTRFADGE